MTALARLARASRHDIAASAGGQRKSRTASGFFSFGIANRMMGWLMGLEPTTTGITILDSTN
jgi:hypothetical protein